ncbi:DoxX family membrane protein [Streptomyces sp. RS10V-4]|uniref:DoxX family membrane protein n=1 Tax=Streptomyces rhizoryzae TaxID=2932493 RepID=UPI002003FC85|nr:DoxX family membrane protein [Streptomyces rhizoryzae]MCK7622920.1 DoxX family membrane protein [Streptomyces rhizoryzae]
MAHAYRTPPAEAGGGTGFRGRLGRHALLPLRLFLGGTFLYAGLRKLTDPAFPAAGGHGSLGELLRQVHGTAAVPQLVELAQRNPGAVGYALAGGEVLVGLGTLAGLLGRVAALGGALISLTLWLTVSWPTTPYPYGNGLAYLLAWTPLVLAGAPRLSLDAALAHRRRRHGRQLYG